MSTKCFVQLLYCDFINTLGVISILFYSGSILITDKFAYTSKYMLNDFGCGEKGERFVSAFTKMELDKLSVMYDGDKDRDDTSKIRGFLFQDYVTIMILSISLYTFFSRMFELCYFL